MIWGVLDQAERNPDSLLTPRPVILDEVQPATQILLAVKRAVDTRRRAGDFTLTGSANRRMRAVKARPGEVLKGRKLGSPRSWGLVAMHSGVACSAKRDQVLL